MKSINETDISTEHVFYKSKPQTGKMFKFKPKTTESSLGSEKESPKPVKTEHTQWLKRPTPTREYKRSIERPVEISAVPAHILQEYGISLHDDSRCDGRGYGEFEQTKDIERNVVTDETHRAEKRTNSLLPIVEKKPKMDCDKTDESTSDSDEEKLVINEEEEEEHCCGDGMKDMPEQCVVCGIVCQNNENAKLHSTVSSGFWCGFEGCCDIVTTELEVQQHLKIHSVGGKPFQCSKCKKRYKGHRNLVKHRLYCFSLTHLSCPKCNRKFSSKKSFDKHSRLH